MGPFALPVPGYRLGIHSRTNKRRKTDDGEGAELEIELEPGWDQPSSHLPSDSINPHSYSPDTLRQLAVAGLEPEDDIPSATYPLFPHKPLPSERWRERRGGRRIPLAEEEGNGDDGEGGGAAAKRADNVTAKQHSDRLRHLGALTAVVHRCLAEGDIARAKRAFGLLVRTKDVDVRLAGFWAVGSEILMRDDGEDQQQPSPHVDHPRRWGTPANVDKVRDYLETLIQLHPHDVHRPHLTSALDFWPALFGVEIYSLDAELRGALRRLRASEEEENNEDDGGGMAYGEDGEDDYERQQRREAARAARDEMRLDARDAAERVARRMDQTMEIAAFGAHRELLRLRGNLSLYVADLCLPSRLVDEDDNDDSRAEEEELSPHRIEDVLRERAESAEEYSALSRRREELEKARGFFRKILDGGGEVDGWVRKLVLAEEEEEHHDADYDGDVW
ncbi:hypothetical protein F4820DRAFT_263503 [Hypoxylon rubiginosum]|uniref:Uncharacterized protein n=1 Tax=Hypoxylon rubiginosum TaxID=110542 RepID=A0ACB9Z397_9PEZI|nr:hypothetical protein F4820DRAFT_263503 [Hypoxylon rubiginosum]